VPLVVIPRNPSTSTSTNVVIDGAVFTPPGEPPISGGTGTLRYLGMAVGALMDPATGQLNLFPVGSRTEDNPQMFYGFLTGMGGSGIIVATGRGSIVTPLSEDEGPLEPGKDVFLSLVPGYVTQGYEMETEGSAYLRIGYALDGTRIVIATDTRIQF